MDKASGRLTVFFENPFWVGVFERIADGKLSVCKVTFGAEPKDYEVKNFILKNYNHFKFTSATPVEVRQIADNPKRRQKNAKKLLQSRGIGTKSQQALGLQREELKTERRQRSKEKRQTQKEHQFDLRRQKRKKKHRGH